MEGVSARLGRALYRSLLRSAATLEKDLGPCFLAHVPYQRLAMSKRLRGTLHDLADPHTPSYSVEAHPVRQLIRRAFSRFPRDDRLAFEALRHLNALPALAQTLPPLQQRRAKFVIGDVVLHNSGRVGVVVSRTLFCKKSRQWILRYLGDLEDPALNQPWYTVLAEHNTWVDDPEECFCKAAQHDNLRLSRQRLRLFFDAYDPVVRRFVVRSDSTRWSVSPVRKGRVSLKVQRRRPAPAARAVAPPQVLKKGRVKLRKTRAVGGVERPPLTS